MAHGANSSFLPSPPSPPLSSSRCSPSAVGCCRAHDSVALPPLSSKALGPILDSRLIACLRAPDGNMAMEAACAALNGGISVVVKGLRKFYPSSIIGVGTVLNAQDARKAIEAGAQFLMSPGTVMDILLDLHNSGVLYIPGAMTPTEVLYAYSTGARIIKIYPTSILGGERYISALKKPFPHIPMVASQGITIDSIGRYIRGGASAVVLSDAIFEKEAMTQRDLDRIQTLAHLATLQVHQAV